MIKPWSSQLGHLYRVLMSVCYGGASLLDPSNHAETSADNQVFHGLPMLMWCLSGKCFVQYKVESPGAGGGGNRGSSVSQL